MSSTRRVPIIDLAPFLDGSARLSVADAILASFKDIGFVCLANHGLSQAKIDNMFSWSKRFFSLPMDIKQLAPHPASGAHHRGYSSPGREKVYLAPEEATSRGQRPADVKESFECGKEENPEMPNIWLPDDALPGMRQACMEFYWDCYQIELSILEALAIGFRLKEDYFLDYHRNADNQLRLLHYPSVSLQSVLNNEVTRIDAHTDYCSLTLLFQDDVGGLEVEDPVMEGKFHPVQPVPGVVVVNAGDFLMRWSNGLIKSTKHRVRAPGIMYSQEDIANANVMARERYSIPYFCSTDLDAIVDCVPGTWSDDPEDRKPKLYQPISAREYIMKRLPAAY